MTKLSNQLHTFEPYKTTEIMNTNIKTSEEFRGTVTIYLNSGGTINLPTQKLVEYVEEQELHSTDIDGSELSHPDTANDWLDVQKNWDLAVASYYNNVICK